MTRKVTLDLVGKKYGFLTVESYSHSAGKTYWNCVCICGNKGVYVGSDITRKRNLEFRSCGCKRGKHGFSKTIEYRTWKRMRNRCNNKKTPVYPHYGGRGITICDRWTESFENFLADMGMRPSPKHSLDRIDVNGNYEPSNCRWATMPVQCSNRRKKSNTGVVGVHFYSRATKKYTAYIYFEGKNTTIGSYETLEEATNARKLAELKHWGSNAS